MILDKQLHSLIEQLASKQAQAEGLLSEIHIKGMELANLNGVWRQLESSSVEVNATRNRFVRRASEKGSASSNYIVEPNYKNPYSSGGRNENLPSPIFDFPPLPEQLDSSELNHKLASPELNHKLASPEKGIEP
ncbi:hypothetical protein F8388_005823 [Cannabis sativa]|uniref:Uncharacterized protein n=1 Tax=Cannabis sativa TaxID=3483 RepID=A0A7J6IAE5_CANSA|nr:hypothetical protein F8388_005823 [Cannabis sativa]KAF4404572.1 hypothetical protein G4B88_005958 [Cannabis sativa]